MFKKALAKFSFLLLLSVLIAPIGKAHAQSTSPTPPQPVVITGGDPEPSGDPDVITGGDPEPSGDPDGISVWGAMAVGTVIAIQLS